MKISETKLLATYRSPKISYGKATGLLKIAPTLVWVIGDGHHITIYPDDAWKFAQMQAESEGTDEMHTDVGGVTFDQWHVTADEGGSVFVNLNGTFRGESDGDEKTQKLAAKLYNDVFKA